MKTRTSDGKTFASNLAVPLGSRAAEGLEPMTDVECLVERALGAAAEGARSLRRALDQLQAAIYVTDEDGVITYFNPVGV
jgi:PAS domain-containing protein